MIKKSFSFFTRKAGKIIILSAAVFLVSGCSLAGIKSPGQSETEGTAQEELDVRRNTFTEHWRCC